MSERLAGIKKAIERCDNQHPAFEHHIDEELKDMYVDGDINFLVEQAERFEILSEQHDGVLAENRRLREALEFYADAKNWSVEIIKDNGNKHRIAHVVNGDSGNIASKALEEIE